MESFKIALKDNLLQVGFSADYPAENDRIVREASEKLERLITTGQISGGTLLKINGPQSVPVCYVIAHKVSHLYGAIAVYDPKLGKYVVCITHTPTYKLGDLIS